MLKQFPAYPLFSKLSPLCQSRSTNFALSLFVTSFLPFASDTARSGDERTLPDLNVPTQAGHISLPLPPNIAIGLFNPDPLLDIAIVEDGYVKVYQNMGNGYYSKLIEQEVLGEVESMGFQNVSGDRNPNPFKSGELSLRFKGGGSQIFSYDQLIFQYRFAPAKLLIPSLNFVEEWRSSPQIQPVIRMEIGDIDNDGAIEIGYPFVPQFGNSNQFVVFQSVADSFVVDWDTLLVGGYGPYAISDLDNDGNKEFIITKDGVIAVIECFGPRQYRYYSTNIDYVAPPFRALETDIDYDGVKEISLLTSNPSPPPGQDATLIYISEFGSKGPIANGWFMSFNIQIARYAGYTFEMAVGQIDGTGSDEIIPAGGSFGVNEPVPIDYLWYNGNTWVSRQINTGLQSGTTAPMFVNLDADSTLELFVGGVGPIGHGSCFALDYVSDTTWNVLWADSSLRNTPLSVNAGMLDQDFIVAGANTWDRPPSDTLYSELHAYFPSGTKLGIWRRDTASVQNFHFLDIDNDGRTNLLVPIISHLIYEHLADYEYYGTTNVQGNDLPTGSFELHQNYPNPFNPGTTIRFAISTKSKVQLTVYDILGKEVKSLANDERPQGDYAVQWNGTNDQGTSVGSGIYFVRMYVSGSTGNSGVSTRKMVLLR